MDRSIKCNGKTKFTKNGAERFIHGKKMSRITSKRTRMYFHQLCNSYHLTTEYGKGPNYGGKYE